MIRLTPVLAALMLAACASPQTRLANDLQDLAEARREAEEEEREAAQKVAKRALKQFPDWALMTPPADSRGFYGVGMAHSGAVPTAIKMSQLEAQYAHAKQLNAELAGGERVAHVDRDAMTSTRYTNLVDLLVDWTPVIGFETVKSEVLPIDGTYHSFVLLHLPYDAFNRVVQDRLQRAEDARSRMQFEDLHRRLGELRGAKQEQAEIGAAAALPGVAPFPD